MITSGNRQMRILVLSRTAWRKDNSFGNTYSNLFGHLKDVQIGNIYLGDGLPDADNTNVVSYYCISEKSMVSNLINRRRVGRRVTDEEICMQERRAENDMYDSAMVYSKKIRLPILFLIREIIWKIGPVNIEDLFEYVENFKPDLIFVSFYYAAYVDRIALQIKKEFDVPMLLEAAIDIYSMKQISFDPFYWINRLNIRRMIRKTVKKSKKLFVISQEMKDDYERMLHIPCSVLYKFPDISRRRYEYQVNTEKPLTFLFTGNIGSGRWKSISILGKAVDENELGKVVVYTATPITKAMRKAMGNCIVHPPVSSDEVLKLQNDADILVHAESFDLKNKLEVRYSISTKIMDYISVSRPIIAIGPTGIASMNFLERNKLAFVCHSKTEIDEAVKRIKIDRSMLKNHADHLRDFVTHNMNGDRLRKEFETELVGIIR